MKTIKRQEEVTYYQCEVCGEEYSDESLALKCERDHKRSKCKHEDKLIEYSAKWGNSELRLISSCEFCGQFLKVKYLSQTSFTQTTLKRMWREAE